MPYDLGIDGDEAVALLESFAERFDVDFSGFRYDDHFGQEAIPLRVGLVLLPLAAAVGALWGWRWWAGAALMVGAVAVAIQWMRNQEGYAHPLTVRDLADAATAGTWTFPYPDRPE